MAAGPASGQAWREAGGGGRRDGEPRPRSRGQPLARPEESGRRHGDLYRRDDRGGQRGPGSGRPAICRGRGRAGRGRPLPGWEAAAGVGAAVRAAGDRLEAARGPSPAPAVPRAARGAAHDAAMVAASRRAPLGAAGWAAGRRLPRDATGSGRRSVRRGRRGEDDDAGHGAERPRRPLLARPRVLRAGTDRVSPAVMGCGPSRGRTLRRAGADGSFVFALQDFKVGNLLGKGSFAGVYRAVSLKTGLEVAIKMVRQPAGGICGFWDQQR